MASKPKNKMPIDERAKQFMPFAALRGLPDALAAKEKILVPKMELSPEMEEAGISPLPFSYQYSIISQISLKRKCSH